MAPQVGLEPTTLRLTAECSAIELLRKIFALVENGIIIPRSTGFVNTLKASFLKKLIKFIGSGTNAFSPVLLLTKIWYTAYKGGFPIEQKYHQL